MDASKLLNCEMQKRASAEHHDASSHVVFTVETALSLLGVSLCVITQLAFGEMVIKY